MGAGDEQLRLDDLGRFEHDGPVQRAVRLILDAGLGCGDSLFLPGSGAWNPSAAAGLVDVVDDIGVGRWHPHLSARPFLFELGQRLNGAPAESIVLAAELVALSVLPLDGLGAASKAERILGLLGRLPGPVEIPDTVDKALPEGLWADRRSVDLGLARWFRDAARFVTYWPTTALQDQPVTRWDPQQLADVVYRSPAPQSLQHLLLHCWNPDQFVPLRGQTHKRQVLAAYKHLAVSDAEGKDLDRHLAEIRQHLLMQRREEVRFYDLPLRLDWHQPHRRPGGTSVLWRVTGPSDPDRQAAWQRGGIIEVELSESAPARSGGRSLVPGMPRPAVASMIDSAMSGAPYDERAELTNAVFVVLSQIAPNDRVLAVFGEEMWLGHATDRVSPLDDRIRRHVRWLAKEPARGWLRPEQLDGPRVLALGASTLRIVDEHYRNWEEAPRRMHAQPMAGVPSLPAPEASAEVELEADIKASPVEVDEPAPPTFRPASVDLADSVHMDREWLQEVIDLLVL